jgi:hypothetical protein
LLAVAKKGLHITSCDRRFKKYLASEETQQRFVEVAKNSLAESQKTGNHITLEEFSDWTKGLKKIPKAAMPNSH